MQLLTANICSDEEYVSCVFEDKDIGLRKTYKLTIFDFIAALEASADEMEFIPLELPSNCLKCSIGRTQSAYITGELEFFVNPRKELVTFCGQNYVIPFPKLLFRLRIVNGIINGSYVFAVKSNDKLAHFPFTNVYNDGKICWGNVQLPMVKSFKDAEKIASLFVTFPGNTDLSFQKTLHKANVASMGELYKKLEEMDKFPNRWLVEM